MLYNVCCKDVSNFVNTFFVHVSKDNTIHPILPLIHLVLNVYSIPFT